MEIIDRVLYVMETRRSLIRQSFYWLAVVAGIGLLFFYKAGSIPLWSSDEGRYGEIAREMFETKQFAVPTFNYLPYLEKPVLAPYLTVVSYALLGVNALSARLPSILSAIFGILMTYGFTRQFFNPRTAKLAVGVLLSTIGYVLVGRFAVIDMIMTLLLSGVFFSLMAAYFEQKRGWYLCAYALMGVAFWAKGLIGIVLPGLSFLVFLAWSRNLRELKWMSLGWGVLIIGVFVASLIALISATEPEFFRVFILEHHFARFATETFGRERPFWFFAPIFISLAFPWSFFIPAAVLEARNQNNIWPKVRYLICWIGSILIFFSIPSSKLPYYILPVSVPVAVLIAVYMDRIFANGVPFTQNLLKVTWNVLLAVSVAGIAILNLYLLFGIKPIGERIEEIMHLRPILVAGSLMLLVVITTGYMLFYQEKAKRSFAVLAAGIYVGLFLTVTGMQRITPFESTYTFAESLKPVLRQNDRVAVIGSPDQFSDFPFYLKQRIIIVGSDRGTLSAESREAEHIKASSEWFLSEDGFIREFNEGEGRVYCLMEEGKLEELTGMGLRNYEVVKREAGKILIVNAG